MDAVGQAQPGASLRASKRSFLRSSIVWKLTLFVGVLVTLNCGVLIGVAYIATSAILRNQIHERLSTVASDRQEMLAYTLEQQEERATQFASRVRIHHLLAQRAEGTISAETFRAEAETMLTGAESTSTGFLALWIEDDSRHGACFERPRGPGCRIFAAETVRGKTGWQPGCPAAASRRGLRLCVLVGGARVGRPGPWARVLLLSDFGPIAAFLMDPNGLEETGEVLVGVDEGKTIRLILPSRRPSTVTEVAASRFPGLECGDRGKVRLHADDRLSRPGRAGGLQARGSSASPGWGLIAKIDSAEAYAPVDQLRWLLLGLGGAALALGLGGIQRDRAAVRTADPPIGQDVFGRRGRRSERSQRGHIGRRDRRL